jgi:hypothetical protein
MVVEVLLDELADDPARDSPDGERGQQWRREQANREPRPRRPTPTPATKVAARRTATLPSGMCVTTITTSIEPGASLTSAPSDSKSFAVPSMSE